MSDLKLRIATRKSALALAQTTMAADAIVAANSVIGNAADSNNARDSLTYELVSMTTEGDRRLDKSLASFGGKGVFIKELEIALLEGRADIAIHSLKDMPAEVLPQFKLAAVLKREDPRDAFLSRGGSAGIRFMDLPAGARVGTGSIRRVVQLKALRPDLEYVPIRGNIQTRIGKLAELDGVVLAAAGLKRMGLADQVTEYFSTEQMLPASGQGILAIETLNDATVQESRVTGRADLAQILARVNDVATYCIASAEMAYLKALNAGCQFPVASFAEFVCEDGIENRGTCGALEENANRIAQTLKIRGIYWDEKSEKLLRAEVAGNVDLNSEDCVQQSKNLGIELACAIQKQL
ncbi:porphobilinogen deaminase [Fibrobacter succinogenes subsp. succinogenes S85]|uniref:Porphobilinogen deaminase n=1 Tax=Fibrobacter succinogenes (strain ATCC 19169 / S85) TaxID=59374 RepID=A0ABN3YYH0_FIBSS|nr:hydroxymethylbilane synthase [Fibrobacter succinogenes]ACX76618.1 porphobilinogen deaminase [Fibrobacter succinogenes subsp. succinogenes S85]